MIMATRRTEVFRDVLDWGKVSSGDVPLGPEKGPGVSDPIYYSAPTVDDRDLPDWIQDLVRQRSIVNMNGTIYIYIKDSSGWVPLQSSRCMSYIVDCSAGYAPVNYAIAAQPYVEIISRRIWPTVVLGNTITQGSVRYEFMYGPSKDVEFIPYGLGRTAKENYCTVPTNVPRAPIHTMSLLYDERVLSYGAISWIRGVFDDHDMRTVLWLLGDLFADFGNKRMFILYGPGGVGKSSVVNIIATAIGGMLTRIGPQYITSIPNSYSTYSLPNSVLLNAACSRLATTADVEVRDGSIINMQTIKALTGNDMGEGGVRVNVTVIATMNKLYVPQKMSDHARADIVRRVCVIPTRLTRSSEDVDTLPIDQTSLEELIRYSLRTRIRYSLPPLSPDAVLYTLYQGRYKHIRCTIEPCMSATLGDCIAVTLLILWTLHIEHIDLQAILHRIGSDCCFQMSGIMWFANMRLIEGARIDDSWYPSKSTNTDRRPYRQGPRSTRQSAGENPVQSFK